MRPYYSQIQVNVPSLLSLMIVSGRNYDLTWVKVLQSGLRKSSFVIMSWRIKKLKQWRTILDPYAWFWCNRFNARYSKFIEVIYKFSAKKTMRIELLKNKCGTPLSVFFFSFSSSGVNELSQTLVFLALAFLILRNLSRC